LKKNGVLEQYRNRKAEHPAHILMFRMGGFYVMFQQDAYVASKVLGLKVISRNLGEGKVPACGVPETAVMKHANSLAKAGYPVAICDQTEEETDGIKNRVITKVVPPPTDTPLAEPVTEATYSIFYTEFKRTLDEPKAEQAIAPKETISAPSTHQKPDAVHQILSRLTALNLNETTPMEAWAILYHWKEVFDPP